MPEGRKRIELDALRQAHLDDGPARERRARLLEAIRTERAAQFPAGRLRRTWPRFVVATSAFAAGAVCVAVVAALASRLGLGPEPALSPNTEPEPTRVAPRVVPAPPPVKCLKALGDAGLLADFEAIDGDGFPLLARLDSRSGAWSHLIHHSTRGVEQGPLVVADSPEPSADNRRALHVHGNARSGWGANIGIELDRCYDASAYEGIEFRARGPGAVFVGLQTMSSVPVEAGGHCESKCWFTGGRFIVLRESFQTYQIRWQDVHPPSGVEESSRELLQIRFNVQAGTAYDFWLDDVRFIEREKAGR